VRFCAVCDIVCACVCVCVCVCVCLCLFYRVKVKLFFVVGIYVICCILVRMKNMVRLHGTSEQTDVTASRFTQEMVHKKVKVKVTL
jgi:hypothetical protein